MILEVGGEARRGRKAEGMDLEGEVVCGKPAQKMSARRLPLSYSLSLAHRWRESPGPSRDDVAVRVFDHQVPEKSIQCKYCGLKHPSLSLSFCPAPCPAHSLCRTCHFSTDFQLPWGTRIVFRE